MQNKKSVAKKKVSGTKKNKVMRQPSKTVIVAGTKKQVRHKRRRVGAVKTKTDLMSVGKILIGSIIGGSVGAIIYKRVPGTGLIKGGVQLAIGGAGMMYLGEKKPFLFGIATGIGTGGGVNILHGAGVIAGLDDMVSGLFDGSVNGARERYREIPAQTAGMSAMTHKENMGLHEGDYVGMFTQQEIDKWVTEGIPGTGGDEWR